MTGKWSKAFRQGNAVYQLNILGDAAIKSIEARFVARVGFDIRTIRVLRLVGDAPGITFGEITDMTGLERSLTSRLIQILVRNDLVERRNDKADARRFGLHVTEEGMRARARADLISSRTLDLMFRDFPPEEVAAFIATMEKIADRIDSEEFLRETEDLFAALDVELEALG